MLSARDFIEVNPEILGGKPIFRGTRVAIQTLFDYLEESSLKDFLNGYPSVSRKQAEAVIRFSNRLITTTSQLYENFA